MRMEIEIIRDLQKITSFPWYKRQSRFKASIQVFFIENPVLFALELFQ